MPAVMYIVYVAVHEYTDASTDHICAHVHLCTHILYNNIIHTYVYIEPSLTLDTLTSVLDGVQRLDDVREWIQIPYSKGDELKHQYDSRQLPRVYSTVFLTDNPSPSWSTVAYALCEAGEHGALEVVQKLYLKGQPCVYRSEG